MRIALDPCMHRHTSIEEMPRFVAELGYEWIVPIEMPERPGLYAGDAR